MKISHEKMNLFSTSLLLFSLYLLLLLDSPVSAASNLNDEVSSDIHKLLSFKSSLLNPNPLQNWQNYTNPCQFTGVFCTNSRVTSINLSSFHLSTDFSSVSTHLFSIELLTSISLSFTNISGSIKPFSVCSSSLSEIDLSHNFISGSLFNLTLFLPCSSLSSLNLSFNSLDSSQILRNLSLGVSLKSLDVSGNHLSGDQVLPWIFSQGCRKLSHLALRENELQGSFNLSNCSYLKYLDISSNNISIQMPNFGKHCPKLEHLDLSSNMFVGKVEDSLVGCNNLSFLNVSNNHFGGEFPLLPSSSIEFLYLSNNKFQGSIPKSLAHDVCSTLVELNLSFNNFSGMIPNDLQSCSLVENFEVASNNFSGNLPVNVFLKMRKLKKLNLAFNHFEGTLSDSFSMISSLESLDLSSNSIVGKIPSRICINPEGKPTYLKELYLQNNLFYGPIPPTLGNCSNLVSLDLSFNFLTGRIPASLGSLSQLKDLIVWMNKLEGNIPSELRYARALENLILDYNDLSGTIPSGLMNCTKLSWISLSNNMFNGTIPSWIGSLSNLTILNLSNNSFYGEIPPELGDCKSLLWLDLNSNLLNGSIPPALAKQSGKMGIGLVGIKYGYLRHYGGEVCQGTGNLVTFAGIRRGAINRIPTQCKYQQIYMGFTRPNFKYNGSMIFLDLSYNNLLGGIPKELGQMFYLTILSLSHNNLSGQIPEELGAMENIGVLDLCHNHLSGLIPTPLGSLSTLTEIDFSSNELVGLIPQTAQFNTFPGSRFANNTGLCGIPLPPCDRKSSAVPSQYQKHRKRPSFAWIVAMGLLFTLFCILGSIVLAMELKKRRRMKDVYMDGNSLQGEDTASAWKYTSNREALSINLATFAKPLRKLTFADLQEATNGFHDDTLIGKGGFGDVYKARLKDGSVVAIKKLIYVSGQGDREFTAEMETLGKIKNPNLVPLLGYCKVREERLLVYEFMKYGSLDDVLHNPNKGALKLNWAARRKIAMGAARGLSFLHHCCSPRIVHRDMKSSNVLIDENLEARVSDFGMARLMCPLDTHLSVSTLAGTPGYVPPEYYQSFRCSVKGDVYSYGVVLLELLTGKKPTESSDFGDNHNLVSWVKMHAKLKISDVFDPELMKEGPNMEIELLEHLKIACACLEDRPTKRPTIIQVLAMFKEIQAGSRLNVIAEGGSFSTTDDVLDMSVYQVHEGVTNNSEPP